MKFWSIVLFTLLLSLKSMGYDKGFDVIDRDEMESENRVALVIGNSNYSRPLTILNNTINDAKAIRAILKKRGFNVIYKENVSHKKFDIALEKFYKKLSHGGVGLFYFSGHGMEFDGQNYLIPIDAKIREKSDTKYEAIALNKLTHRMQKVGNRLNIVILDACRNDPFTKAYGVGGLAKSEPMGLFVSYATGAGQVSSDGRVGENGLFTKYLIKNMKKPLSLQDVFKKTRASVYNVSSGKQFPAIYDQVIQGNFYFTLPTKANNDYEEEDKEDVISYRPTFEVTPYNATIRVDGKRWYKGDELIKGRHIVKVIAQGYKTKSKRINLVKNRTYHIILNRKRSFSTPPAPPPQPRGAYPYGYIIQPCGCWGANPIMVKPASVCQSGYAGIAQCQWYCPTGGVQYGYRCQ